MPCWFYDKKELINTPSARDGISAEVEAWYRKEGAKHIIDAGNKLGLYLFSSIRSLRLSVMSVHFPDYHMCTATILVKTSMTCLGVTRGFKLAITCIVM